jgi:hypothetical protein
MRKKLGATLALSVVCALLAGCVAYAPPPPGPHYGWHWVPGHYNYAGGWVPGHYAP